LTSSQKFFPVLLFLDDFKKDQDDGVDVNLGGGCTRVSEGGGDCFDCPEED
jgi:hypothetical protein